MGDCNKKREGKEGEKCVIGNRKDKRKTKEKGIWGKRKNGRWNGSS